MILPKLVITDIDGVWTDGGMYYDNLGNEWKKFNTSDSAGVLFLKKLNIPVWIMIGENSIAAKNRGTKLKVEQVFLGVRDKLTLATKNCRKMGIELSEVAFIGDDINDLRLLQQVGLSAAPDNAPSYVKEKVSLITQKRGGEGAFREFVETILTHHNLMDEVLADFL